MSFLNKSKTRVKAELYPQLTRARDANKSATKIQALVEEPLAHMENLVRLASYLGLQGINSAEMVNAVVVLMEALEQPLMVSAPGWVTADKAIGGIADTAER